jgi:hypothetical protein
MTYTVPIIAIPAGKCPVKLTSTEYNDVIEWAEEVYSFGIKNNINYLPSALVFFAQQFFSIFGEEYKVVCDHINTTYNNQDKIKLNEIMEKVFLDKKIADKEKQDRLDDPSSFVPPPKKKRGRPPKAAYNPSQTMMQKPLEPASEKVKINIKRK